MAWDWWWWAASCYTYYPAGVFLANKLQGHQKTLRLRHRSSTHLAVRTSHSSPAAAEAAGFLSLLLTDRTSHSSTAAGAGAGAAPLPAALLAASLADRAALSCQMERLWAEVSFWRSRHCCSSSTAEGTPKGLGSTSWRRGLAGETVLPLGLPLLEPLPPFLVGETERARMGEMEALLTGLLPLARSRGAAGLA